MPGGDRAEPHVPHDGDPTVPLEGQSSWIRLSKGRVPGQAACNTTTKALGICPREPGFASSALTVPCPKLPNHLWALLNSVGLCGFDVPLIGFICHGEGFNTVIPRGELTLPLPGSHCSGPRGTQPGTLATMAGVCQACQGHILQLSEPLPNANPCFLF